MKLPRQWPAFAQLSFLNALAMARMAIMRVRGWCADSRLVRVRLAGERDAAVARLALLEEEARILRARLAAIDPRRRPQYPPVERMAILALRAHAGWTTAESARRFLLTETTIASWTARLDEDGPRALVQVRSPVNEWPALLAALIRELAARCPALGTRRIAAMLARAGVLVGATTVARKLKRPAHEPDPTADPHERTATPPAPAGRAVTARAPHHVWHVDITLLPTGGLWVPWLPFSLPPTWPFCFWLAVVLDHYSRAVVGWRIFRKQPSGEDVVQLLDEARGRAGNAPRYVITDQGPQFRTVYREWCQSHEVRPRFGAIGQHGSIAVIERFFRSLKNEMFATRPLSLAMPTMEVDIAAYVRWYNEHRPHQTLGGLTPAERLVGAPPIAERELVEPRARYPIRDATRRRVARLELVVDHVDGRANLPIVSLREAA